MVRVDDFEQDEVADADRVLAHHGAAGDDPFCTAPQQGVVARWRWADGEPPRRAARKWLATAPSERAFSLRRSAQHHTHKYYNLRPWRKARGGRILIIILQRARRLWVLWVFVFF